MKFEIEKQRNGQFYFRIKASNGQILAHSEGYTAKASARSRDRFDQGQRFPQQRWWTTPEPLSGPESAGQPGRYVTNPFGHSEPLQAVCRDAEPITPAGADANDSISRAVRPPRRRGRRRSPPHPPGEPG